MHQPKINGSVVLYSILIIVCYVLLPAALGPGVYAAPNRN
jgi:hypothetical protein